MYVLYCIVVYFRQRHTAETSNIIINNGKVSSGLLPSHISSGHGTARPKPKRAHRVDAIYILNRRFALYFLRFFDIATDFLQLKIHQLWHYISQEPVDRSGTNFAEFYSLLSYLNFRSINPFLRYTLVNIIWCNIKLV